MSDIALQLHNGVSIFVDSQTGCFSTNESETQWTRLRDLKAHLDSRITVDKLIAMTERKSYWVIGDKTLHAIRNLKDYTGRYVMSRDGAELLGYPVFRDTQDENAVSFSPR